MVDDTLLLPTLDSLPQQLLILDGQGAVIAVNRAWHDFRESIGLPDTTPVGRSFTATLDAGSVTDASDREALAEGVRAVLAGRLEQYGHTYPLALASRTLWIELFAVALPAGRPGAVVSLFDVTQDREAETHLVAQANRDALTGLPNRRSFEYEAERALSLAKRRGSSLAVVFLDLDDFKDVNDSFGHRAGDEVLVAVAEQLRKHVRESDVLARLGGDEFAVLLPQTTRRESEAAARRMLDAINTHTCSVQGHAVRVNASLGLVMYPQHGATAQDLLANADAAMYRAKETGRSHLYVHLFEPGLHDDMRKRIGWNERISSALRDDGFVVHAQPILDLRSDAITRYELLVRMQAEDGKLIAPSEFLPMAERLGLINEIDRWMISQAVALLRRHRLQLLNLDVNLSGKAFADQTIVGYISDALSSAHISPSRLGVEITETAAIADISKAQVFIGALKEMGCRISLDDFGSGFSSFYYLKHLPIDCLKVDGSFIRSLPESEQDRHLVRGVVDLCRGLKLEVVAEYVEDAERLRLVRELGFDYAQGFQVGRPGPAAKAIAMAPTEATG